MRLLGSVAIGMFVAVLAAVLSMVASIAIPIGLDAWQASHSDGGGGIVAVSIGIPSWPMLLAATAGFAIGFTWDRRRARRKLAS
jgi:hypothetical protein